jgi:oligopeptide transport system ATP-binding protein
LEPVLKLDDWSVGFDTPEGTVEAVRGVSLDLMPGEVLAIVGESGCGKSVLCQSILKILPRTAKTTGRVFAAGTDISAYPEGKMRKLRGPFFAMLFQDPMTTLNPTIPIGKQITEAILKHHKVSREEANRRAIATLDLVGIDDPVHRLALQPHFFSGGMRQRCVLAIAMALEPKVLLADEPTTALDVTVQARMLDILKDVKDKKGLSIIFISHDLGVVARVADRVAVMYAGKIVEIGKAEEIFYDPRHPYTWGLLSSMPSVAVETGVFGGIPGLPPTLLNPPPGDAFAYRNRYALKIDYEEMPPMFPVSETHFAATWLLDPRAPRVEPPLKLTRRPLGQPG